MRARKNEKLRNRRDEKSRVLENEELKGRKDEESKDLFSSNLQTAQARPPPGFSALNPILEEAQDKPIINPEDFITPNIPKNPNIPEAFTPDFSFMDSNLPQNSYPNFIMNGSNIFSLNGLNTGVSATKLQMEILKMQLQINNLAMMVSQSSPKVSNATAAVILQGQINNLMQQVQEMQLRSTQLTNSNLQVSNHQSVGSPHKTTPSPSNFIKLTFSPSQSPTSTDFVPNLPSTRTSPIPSSFSYSQLSSSSGNSYQSASSRVGTPGSEFPSNNYERTNPSVPKEKVDETRNFCDPKNRKEDSPLKFSDNMEDFFKGVPKLSEKTETFKNTNPFKRDFTENKIQRANLQSFYDAPASVPSRDPILINKPETEYIKTLNEGKETSSVLFVSGKEKEEGRSSNLRKSLTSNFDNVCPITEKVNQNSKIIYEAGPVMYNRKEPEIKTDSYSYDKSRWKPIPPAAESSQSRETVKINMASFNITKPKSPAERLKEQQLKSNLDFQTTVKDSPLNVTDKNSGAIITLNDFTTFPDWRNTHILSPGKLSNNENQSDEVSNCNQENYRTMPVQRPPAEIFVTVRDTSPKPKSEIFATITEDRNLNETKPFAKREESLRIPFENRETIDETMCSPKTAGSYVSRNTNPFMEDFALKNSEKEVNHALNGVNKDLKTLKLTENTEESRTEPREVPACQDDSSVCFMYQLSRKNMSVIVINMDNEGWMCTDEFVTAFTYLHGGGSVLLSVLEMISLKVPFKIVDRSTHPSLFFELDYTPLAVQRDLENRICRPVHLTPLKSTLRILTKMKIIKREDMNTAVCNKQYEEGTIISDIVKLISSYGTFMRTKCKD